MHNLSNEKSPRLTEKHLRGMFGFTIIWIGQMLSLLGTAMTGFALTIWAWQVTGVATALALVGVFATAPLVLVSPLAGALVDRYNRKKVMMLGDLAAGIPTIGILLLFLSGSLQIWHLYIAVATSAVFQAFHFPAYSAAVTMMLPKEQYGRANGMLAMAQFASGIFAPIVAAILLSFIGLPGVLAIDIVTFTVAITMLLFVHIPQPPITEAGRKGMGSIWKESLYGFRYIFERPSLLGLQLIFFAINLTVSFSNVLLAPMILTRTGNNTIVLGSVQSAAGVGGLIGSLLLTVWGGTKRKVHGVLTGMALTSLLGVLLTGLGRDSCVWILASFSTMFFIPLINGSNQAIWQAKVAPDVQGRVFATRLLIAQISAPVAMALAGPMADNFFEPSMKSSGGLAQTFGWLVGTGPGTGMALMFVITGVLGAIIGFGGYAIRVVRNAENILPDHEVGIAKPEGE